MPSEKVKNNPIMRKYIPSRIITQIADLLKQGITPEKIALSMAWGITLGTLPVLGVTSILCIAVALVFRLNVVVTQLGNWLAYPLQIVLFIPFFMAGAYLFGYHPLTGDLLSRTTLSMSDFTQTLRLLGGTTLQAAFVWALAAPLMILVLYGSIKPVLKRALATGD